MKDEYIHIRISREDKQGLQELAGKKGMTVSEMLIYMIRREIERSKYMAQYKYTIRDREAGNIIASFETLEEAQEELKTYEEQDKKEGTYTEDFYEIVEF